MTNQHYSKRSRLFAAVVLMPALAFGAFAGGSHPAQALLPNPIPAENANTGSDKWELVTFLNEIPAKEELNHQEVVGYASDDSVVPGGVITFHVSVSPTRGLDKIEIYRMGYYQGKSGRLMATTPAIVSVASEPACPLDAVTGRYECAWPSTHALNVPNTWLPGVYIAKLYSTDGARAAPNQFTSHITFVVQDPTRAADILYVHPGMSYAAYNNYPRDPGAGTGKRLFSSDSFGANTIAGTAQAVKVSLDRPEIVSDFSGFSWGNSDFAYDLHLVRWLERTGYNVTYATDIDVHENPALLKNYSVVVMGMRAEYWTNEMYTGFEQARDAGVHLVFPSAATAFWQVRLEPNSAGKPNRTVVGYKNAAIDPEPIAALKTINFRAASINRAEQRLVGVMYDGAAPIPLQPYTVTNASLWVYAGAGVSNGSVITDVTGATVDRLYTTFPTPISTSYELLSISPYGAVGGIQNTSIYTAPSGAMVFASGTLGWAWALDRRDNRVATAQDYVKPQIQLVTKNILDRMIANPVKITGLQVAANTPTRLGDTTVFTATVATGQGVAYDWAFGDGGTATGSNPTYVYGAAGLYTAIVTATNASGVFTAGVQVNVTNAAPIADAGTNQGVVAASAVTLNASSSNDPDGHLPLQYLWTQTAGPVVALSSRITPNPTFLAPGAAGPVSFSLIVTDSRGLQSTVPDLVDVVVGSVAISGLTAQNSSPTILGSATAFSASITAGSSVTYTWSFGDGTSASGANVSKTYAVAGTYTATVTATNAVGPVVTQTLVTIRDVPVQGLAITPSIITPTVGVTTTFGASQSAGTGITYTWLISGPVNASGIGSPFAYQFTAPGTYTITVTARNTSGVVTSTRQIVVRASGFRSLLPIIGRK